MRLAPALAMLLWAGAAAATEVLVLPEQPPPGYPPKLGAASGRLGQKAVAWEFFDFSIGAFDASAWVDSDWSSKAVTFHLMGFAPGDPDDKRFRLRVSGDFGQVFQAGAATAPLIEVLRGDDLAGPRLTSSGQRAEIVIESVGAQPENSYLRPVTGRIEARLCPKAWLFKSCQDMSLRFTTKVQIGSDMAVKD